MYSVYVSSGEFNIPLYSTTILSHLGEKRNERVGMTWPLSLAVKARGRERIEREREKEEEEIKEEGRRKGNRKKEES